MKDDEKGGNSMEQKKYLISDAAKQVNVESHVLRYWEEELELPIKRNKQGHRFYTTEDVERLKRIKMMKEQGFQLKAIKTALREENGGTAEMPVIGKVIVHPERKEETGIAQAVSPDEKALRLQLLLKNLMIDAIREGNEEFCEVIKESLLKELDYQFRLQEEREEEREIKRQEKEEEHFKRIDELLREKSIKNEKKKKHSFF